jgi:hypothetical protein
MMTHRRDAAVVVVAGLLGAGCARYTWVNELDSPGLCPAGSPPSAGAFEQDNGEPLLVPGVIEGVVVSAGDSTPLRDVVAAAYAPSATAGAPAAAQASSDSLGYFRMPSLPAGGYLLVTRRMGYEVRRDTVQVGEAGARVRITLPRLVFDGPCSGATVVRVRQPWWKL